MPWSVLVEDEKRPLMVLETGHPSLYPMGPNPARMEKKWKPKFSVGIYSFRPGAWKRSATPRDIARGLEQIKKFEKIKGVEFFYPDDVQEESVDEIKEMCSEHGLQPANVFSNMMEEERGSKGSLGSPDRKVRAAALERCKQSMA